MGHLLEGIDVLPEAEVNVFCARSEAGAARLPWSSPHLDWEKNLEYAQIHGVLQFLAAALTRAEISPPEPWGGILTTQHQRNTVRAMVQHRECLRIVEALVESGIPAVPFKGTSLSKLLYGRVAERISADIDILIPMAHLRHAQTVLGGLDYVVADTASRLGVDALLSSGNEMTFVNQSGVVVEIHWRLFEVDRACGFPIDFEKLHMVGDQIANEDLFLVLVLHGLIHRWEVLKWVVDIDAFARNVTLNWEVVFRRASESGTIRATRIALLLAHHLFDTNLPEPITDRTADRLARRYVRCLLTTDRIPPVADFWMQIAARERWIDRLRFVRFVMRPQPWDQSAKRFKTLSRFLRLVLQSFRRSRLAEIQKIPELQIPVDERTGTRHSI